MLAVLLHFVLVPRWSFGPRVAYLQWKPLNVTVFPTLLFDLVPTLKKYIREGAKNTPRGGVCEIWGGETSLSKIFGGVDQLGKKIWGV